jgi:hypothetical protein
MPVMSGLGAASSRSFGRSLARGPLIIFNYGTQNTIVTGGWSYDDCWNPPGTSGVGTQASYFYQNSNGLSIYSPYWGCGTASTINNVNLSGVKSVTITYSGSNLGYYSNGGVSWPLSDCTNHSYGSDYIWKSRRQRKD